MLKNKMDADDVTQEVLIKIWLNLDKFMPSSVASWIMKTTHNLCIDYLRKRSVELKRTFEIDETAKEIIPDIKNENDPVIVTHFKMIGEKIKEAIKRLPEQLRSVFVLYEIEGLKYIEISQVLDMPLNSVKVYLLRARKKLQEELRSYESRNT